MSKRFVIWHLFQKYSFISWPTLPFKNFSSLHSLCLKFSDLKFWVQDNTFATKKSMKFCFVQRFRPLGRTWCFDKVPNLRSSFWRKSRLFFPRVPNVRPWPPRFWVFPLDSEQILWAECFWQIPISVVLTQISHFFCGNFPRIWTPIFGFLSRLGADWTGRKWWWPNVVIWQILKLVFWTQISPLFWRVAKSLRIPTPILCLLSQWGPDWMGIIMCFDKFSNLCFWPHVLDSKFLYFSRECLKKSQHPHPDFRSVLSIGDRSNGPTHGFRPLPNLCVWPQFLDFCSRCTNFFRAFTEFLSTNLQDRILDPNLGFFFKTTYFVGECITSFFLQYMGLVGFR